MAFSERELLARLIQCEAGGEGENGMKAVATVIMNRARTTEGEFARVNQGGSVRNVIMQPNQFTCLLEYERGLYNAQNIYNMNPQQEHYDIADWALAGNRLQGIDDSLFFFNPYSDECPPYFPAGGAGVLHNRLGEHCFYRPTAQYANT